MRKEGYNMVRVHYTKGKKRRKRHNMRNVAITIGTIIFVMVGSIGLSQVITGTFGNGSGENGLVSSAKDLGKAEEKLEVDIIKSDMDALITTQNIPNTADVPETEEVSTKDKTSQIQPIITSNTDIAKKKDTEKSNAGSKKESIDNSYFEDALFIGDSRTEGLFINTGLTEATFYAHKGLNVKSVYDTAFIKNGKKKLTVFQALKKKQFKKIYIMFGVNELGWSYESVFVDKYAEIIKDIKKVQPDATIYVQSILPVSKKKSDGDKIYNNTNIKKFNKLIKKMAEDEEVTYLNVAAAVMNKKGSLPAEASTDGVHLNKKYCEKWLDYIKEQASKEKK